MITVSEMYCLSANDNIFLENQYFRIVYIWTTWYNKLYYSPAVANVAIKFYCHRAECGAAKKNNLT